MTGDRKLVPPSKFAKDITHLAWKANMSIQKLILKCEEIQPKSTFAGSGTIVHWSGANLAFERVVIPVAD